MSWCETESKREKGKKETQRQRERAIVSEKVVQGKRKSDSLIQKAPELKERTTTGI